MGSIPLPHESDDTVNDDATEITSSRESRSNTSLLEATEIETQNHKTVDVSFKLSPLVCCYRLLFLIVKLYVFTDAV